MKIPSSHRRSSRSRQSANLPCWFLRVALKFVLTDLSRTINAGLNRLCSAGSELFVVPDSIISAASASPAILLKAILDRSINEPGNHEPFIRLVHYFRFHIPTESGTSLLERSLSDFLLKANGQLREIELTNFLLFFKSLVCRFISLCFSDFEVFARWTPNHAILHLSRTRPTLFRSATRCARPFCLRCSSVAW